MDLDHPWQGPVVVVQNSIRYNKLYNHVNIHRLYRLLHKYVNLWLQIDPISVGIHGHHNAAFAHINQYVYILHLEMVVYEPAARGTTPRRPVNFTFLGGRNVAPPPPPNQIIYVQVADDFPIAQLRATP